MAFVDGDALLIFEAISGRRVALASSGLARTLLTMHVRSLAQFIIFSAFALGSVGAFIFTLIFIDTFRLFIDNCVRIGVFFSLIGCRIETNSFFIDGTYVRSLFYRF